jgi:hypothetical protein
LYENINSDSFTNFREVKENNLIFSKKLINHISTNDTPIGVLLNDGNNNGKFKIILEKEYDFSYFLKSEISLKLKYLPIIALHDIFNIFEGEDDDDEDNDTEHEILKIYRFTEDDINNLLSKKN